MFKDTLYKDRPIYLNDSRDCEWRCRSYEESEEVEGEEFADASFAVAFKVAPYTGSYAPATSKGCMRAAYKSADEGRVPKYTMFIRAERAF